MLLDFALEFGNLCLFPSCPLHHSPTVFETRRAPSLCWRRAQLGVLLVLLHKAIDAEKTVIDGRGNVGGNDRSLWSLGEIWRQAGNTLEAILQVFQLALKLFVVCWSSIGTVQTLKYIYKKPNASYKVSQGEPKNWYWHESKRSRIKPFVIFGHHSAAS